jgi:two-component system, chemotaxis family, sensor kinase CheA
MDDLLRDFLTETGESLDYVDVELVKFEQDPNNARILDNIFRLVHTIKGTCGFLGLPRLEAIAHAAETLMGKFRDGVPVTGAAVTLILASIDRIKSLLGELERTEAEPSGSDHDLISQLEAMALQSAAGAAPAPAPEPVRALRVGEVSEEDLERAFREAEGPDIGKASNFWSEPAPTAQGAAPVDEPEPPPAPAVVKTGDILSPSEGPDVAARRGKGDGEKEGTSLAAQSIRVNVDTLEQLMTMVSELVLTRNQLLEIVRRHEDSEFKVPLQRLSNVTAELQEGVMKTRMQPIGTAWQKLPRIVRDLAQDLNKMIDLEMVGADTELDRQVLDLIKDPLTHMVRNSADHGLEKTEERRAAGKSERGTIRLSAYHEGGHIIIDISDDGRGLNTARIREKVLENRLASEADVEKMTDSQIQKFIFAPGFSTAAQVTNVSGRGVGMDVVRNNIEVIGGTIDVQSRPGQGSSFIIKIPLTLAIVPALIVEAFGQRFAIPQIAVVELVRAQSNSDHRIERIKDTPVLRLRNKLLPLIHLSSLLNFIEEGEQDPENGFIVVSQVGGHTFGIVVDGVFHTEEIVVKPMSSRLRHINMFSGTTILGDGSVIMILDPNGVAAAAAGTGQRADEREPEAITDQTLAGGGNAVSLLVFRADGAQPKAVPLSLITRLEEISVSSIEHANGRSLVQYRGKLMPLVPVRPGVAPRAEGTQPLLVFSDDGRSMGIMVDEIVDIVEEKLNIDVSSDQEGVLGTAIIKGHATEIIDVAHYLPLAFEDWLERKDTAQQFSGPKQLLFVDDSPFFRNMLTPVLRAAGYDVTTVASAPEALQIIGLGRNFDVVVSDIEMPEMSGFDFAETLRAQEAYQSTPIIALSSLTTPSAIERGRKAGFDDYVAKFDRPGLISALKEVNNPPEVAA